MLKQSRNSMYSSGRELLRPDQIETFESNNNTPRLPESLLVPVKQKETIPFHFADVVETTLAVEKFKKEEEGTYNFEVHGKRLKFAKNSLWILSDKNEFRKSLVWFVESRWFDIGISLIIVLNTVFLALTDYEVRVNPTKQSVINDVISVADMIFSVIFIIEFILKVIAMGFLLEEGTYLRNGWNVVDFIVVIISIINNIPGVPNLTALRSIRTLKPLRSINTINVGLGMKALVGSLIESLPALANVGIFLSFLVIVYSILGVELFSGAFENRCRLTPSPVNGVWQVDPTYLDLCGVKQCPASSYCGNPADFNIPKNWSEILIPELVYGIPNFDNIINATLTVFQSVTTEGWSANTYLYTHTFNPAVVYLYFCSLVVIGAFFALNLILAVITDTFHTIHSKDDKDFKHSNSLAKTKSLKSRTATIDSSHTGPAATPKKPLEKVIERLTENNTTIQDVEQEKKEYNFLSKFSSQTKEFAERNGMEPIIPMLPFVIDVYLNERTQKSKIYYYAYKLVLSKAFSNTFVLLIIINVTVLALYKYPDDTNMNQVLEIINNVLTFVFVVEMLLKLLGLGFYEYAKDRFNLFDALLVIISVVDFITDNILGSNSGLAIVMLFRSFRLFRIFKLARSWTSFRSLLTVLVGTLKDIKNFFVLLLLFMIIASLLGEELFAYKASFSNGQFPRLSFNSFFDALITVFALLTAENWNNIMNDHIRTVGGASAFYFVFVVIIGNYILLKLFLAILISNFQDSEISNLGSGTLGNIISKIKGKSSANSPEKNSFKVIKLKSSLFKPLQVIKSKKNKILPLTPTSGENSPQRRAGISFERSMSIQKESSASTNVFSAGKISRGNSLRRQSTFFDASSTANLQHFEILKNLSSSNINLDGMSLFVFSSKNEFRKLLARLITHSAFETFVLITIVCSSITLALDSPIEDPSTSFSQAISIIDKITTFIFAVEMLLKIIAYGFLINGPQSYLRNSWNIMDSLIVVISIVSLAFDLAGGNQNVQLLNQLKVLRTLRVLRPLRLISKNEGIKLALNSILAAIPSLMNLIFVCFLFFLLFGVIGVNFFKGNFYYCDMTNINQIFQSAIIIKQDCMDYGGDWVGYDANFDNTLQAILTLFQLATTEGWLDIINTVRFTGIDSVGVDLQPIQNNRKAWAIFFIAFIIVGSFFILNLFAGVVVDTFNREKDRLDGLSFLTKEQQVWVNMKLTMVQLKPEIESNLPSNKISKKLRQITSNKKFEIFIVILMLANMVVFALHWDRQDETLALVLDTLNYFLLFLFTLEAVLKIIGYGRAYFKEGWNVFDFLIILASVISIIVDKVITLEGVNLGSSTSVLRTFRAGRVLRLVARAKSLRAIFNTIIITLPALANIGGLLLLVLFIYSSLGNSLFAYQRMGNYITTDANFQTFGSSFFTLFKSSTGEAWNAIFLTCSKKIAPNYACIDISSYDDFKTYGYNDCGSGVVATLYFISFQIIFTYIMLNLFIAIIIEAFNKSKNSEDAILTEKEYKNFKEVFKKLDPKGKGLILEHELDALLQEIDPPLAEKSWRTSSKQRNKFIIQADLPVYFFPNSSMKYYQFHDILLRLSERAVQKVHNLDELENFSENNSILKLKEVEKKRLKHLQKVSKLKIYHLSGSYLKAAALITTWIKRRKERKQKAAEKEAINKEMMTKTEVQSKISKIKKTSFLQKDKAKPIQAQQMMIKSNARSQKKPQQILTVNKTNKKIIANNKSVESPQSKDLVLDVNTKDEVLVLKDVPNQRLSYKSRNLRTREKI